MKKMKVSKIQHKFILCLLLSGIMFAVGQAESNSWTFSTRSFTNTWVGSDPYTLTYDDGNESENEQDTIRVNLTALRYANITRATLDPYVEPTASIDRYQIVTEGGQTLQLFPPRYLTFDVTNAVRQAVSAGKEELVLRVVDNGQGFGKTISLNVWSNTPAPRPIQQIWQTSARHEQGDTMITFREATNPPAWGNQWTFGGYSAAMEAQAHDQPTRLRYRIYRSTVPFTHPSVVGSAELIDEIMPYSGWNAYLNGTEAQIGSKAGQPIPMLPIDDDQLAPIGTGIYVRRHTGWKQTGYYLVSTVVNGAEDFSSLVSGKNVSEGVYESGGQGMTLRWKTEDMIANQTPRASIDVRFDYFIRWEETPLPNQPYNYRVGIPTDEDIVSDRPPLTIAFHAWNGDLDSYGAWPWKNYDDGALFLTSNVLDYTGASAVHEFKDTLRPWQDGTAQPFYQARMLSFIYDYMKPTYHLDTQKMVLFGESMGSTAVHLWGTRSGHLFSQLYARAGHHIPASDDQWRWQFETNGYGDLEWDIRYSNRQLARYGYPQVTPKMNVSVWDYYDTNQWLRDNPTIETPYITYANAPNDHAIGWEESWLVTRAMIDTKRAFNFTWSTHGHHTPLANAPAIVNQSQSLPVFSNASFNSNLGAWSQSTWQSGAINGYHTWLPESIVDTTNRWSVVLSLTEDAPRPWGTVSVTPRRLQQFRVNNGVSYQWTLTDKNGVVSRRGTTTAHNDLLTIPYITLSKQPTTLTVTR